MDNNIDKSRNIEIPETIYHRIVRLLSILILAGIFLYLLVMWKQFPGQIPGHYNGAGEIDRWGSKYELLFCPIMAVILFVLTSFVEKHPSIWNTGVEITKENKQRVYLILKNMIVTLKFVIVLMFVFITVISSLARPLPGWFLPLSLLLTFGPMAYYLIQLYRHR